MALMTKERTVKVPKTFVQIIPLYEMWVQNGRTGDVFSPVELDREWAEKLASVKIVSFIRGTTKIEDGVFYRIEEYIVEEVVEEVQSGRFTRR